MRILIDMCDENTFAFSCYKSERFGVAFKHAYAQKVL